jgi:hypothetical protein
MNAKSPDAESPLIFGNYAVGFIDLLGQRAALRGQQLLPHTETDEDKQKLVATLKASVGSIAALQQYALGLARGSEPDAPASVLHGAPTARTTQRMRMSGLSTTRHADGRRSWKGTALPSRLHGWPLAVRALSPRPTSIIDAFRRVA